MRATLLSWLPDDLHGLRLLDAGCGTGALSIEAAKRGAQVVAVDIAPSLLAIAENRAAEAGVADRIGFRAGDMLDPAHGRFDHVLAMDSLIHYAPEDTVDAVAALAARAETSVAFTFAPRTKLLAAMHAVGRFFPRGDRAPAIVPVADATLRALLGARSDLASWRAARDQRIASGFYTSHALELRRR
jgi:magnesium-protoporphyrin O-methyltransferase